MSWLEQIRQLAAKLPELGVFRARSAEFFLVLLLLAFGLIYWSWPSRPPDELLNIAFDAAQPLFVQVDQGWREQSGASVYSLHAGSIRQTQTLTTVLVADTICAASAGELDTLIPKEIVAEDWRNHFPHEASPFYSYIVFLARPGAADSIQDWPDLFESNLRYVLPSPDVSGAGRHAYLALAHNAEQRYGNNDWIYSGALKNTVFLPYGARRCAEIFLMDPSMDLLVTWESEALRLLEDNSGSEWKLIYPKQLIRVDVSVAVALPQTERRGTQQNAGDYLRFLYSPEAREYIRTAGFHPAGETDSSADSRTATSIQTLFGSWQAAIDTHLDEDGTYHRLAAYRKARSGGNE